MHLSLNELDGILILFKNSSTLCKRKNANDFAEGLRCKEMTNKLLRKVKETVKGVGALAKWFLQSGGEESDQGQAEAWS